ncbi:uncharacterized protein LOC135398580 [Ornithodoros turicata]|uniref:uncharacterized protein LOC135398580 n=1 Tax=Ornithodoros turicata TaxID=34597 RepID=UPI0031394634
MSSDYGPASPTSSPVPPPRSSARPSYQHPLLQTATHVFVRHDGVRKPLQAPYDGPFLVVSRGPKHFTVQIANRTETVSLDRLKPAFLDDEVDAPRLLPQTVDSPILPSTSPATPLNDVSAGPLRSFISSTATLRGEPCSSPSGAIVILVQHLAPA